MRSPLTMTLLAMLWTHPLSHPTYFRSLEWACLEIAAKVGHHPYCAQMKFLHWPWPLMWTVPWPLKWTVPILKWQQCREDQGTRIPSLCPSTNCWGATGQSSFQMPIVVILLFSYFPVGSGSFWTCLTFSRILLQRLHFAQPRMCTRFSCFEDTFLHRIHHSGAVQSSALLLESLHL